MARKMKDSGVEWIGDIPEGWSITRIKDISTVKRGASPRPIDDRKYFSDTGCRGWVRISDVTKTEKTSGYLYQTEEKLSSLGESFSVKREPGDIFLSIAGSVGKPCIARIPVCIHDGFVYFPNMSKNSTRFFFYVFESGSLFDGLGKTGTQLNLNTSSVGTISVPYPNITEQQAIAAFLDRETMVIDRRLSLIGQKKQLLVERRKATIHEAVTKGLDRSVPMKDSGVEWIGNIPDRWKTLRIKDVLSERQNKNSDNYGNPITENILSVMKDIGVINYEDKGNVGNKKSDNISGYKLVEKGDLVANKMNILIGSCGISPEYGALSVVYIVMTEKQGNMKYWGYVFACKQFQKHLRTIAKGILEIREAVDMDMFWQQELPIPSEAEQQAIADFLDHETSIIDRQIEALTKMEGLLIEQRKALIHEAVTGKIEIS